MKIKILISLVILALNISLLFGNTETFTFNDRPVEHKGVWLTPNPPMEADFNENVPELAVDYRGLAPATPLDATFEEEMLPETICLNGCMKTLSPSTPVEADFEEDATYSVINISLTPAAPNEADFEDKM
jgi:hypothetical protein